MDRRLLRFNGNIAHVSLRGKVEASKFVVGKWMQVVSADTPILASPDGPRDRELLFGQEFCVLDALDNHAFGFSRRDGYCGYVRRKDLCKPTTATHLVSVRQTYIKKTPDLKNTEPHWPLSFGSRLLKTGVENGWAKISMPSISGITEDYFLPDIHLKPVDWLADDPVSVAKIFLGTPYLWGGNTAMGIDCSGLIQTALLACKIDCPGDSDLQEQTLGRTLNVNEAVQPGDLYFWKGHVAMATDETHMIHANAHHMSVTAEPIAETVRRIADQGGGEVTSRKRL